MAIRPLPAVYNIRLFGSGEYGNGLPGQAAHPAPGQVSHRLHLVNLPGIERDGEGHTGRTKAQGQHGGCYLYFCLIFSTEHDE